MRPKSFISFAGFVMLIAASFCPLLRPLHLFNWNMYQCNQPYGIVILLVAVVGITGLVFMQIKIARMAAWLSLVLVVLFYLLVLLKIHTSFSFIPFHSLEKYLDRQIKFKWGWWLLIIAPVLALAGALTERTAFKIPGRQSADQEGKQIS